MCLHEALCFPHLSLSYPNSHMWNSSLALVSCVLKKMSPSFWSTLQAFWEFACSHCGDVGFPELLVFFPTVPHHADQVNWTVRVIYLHTACDAYTKLFSFVSSYSKRQVREDICAVFREADAVRWDHPEGRRARFYCVQGECVIPSVVS